MSRKSPQSSDPPSNSANLFGAIAVVFIGTLLISTCMQTCLSTERLSASFISPSTWSYLVGRRKELPFYTVAAVSTTISILSLTCGAWFLSMRTGRGYVSCVARWGLFGWGWWCLAGLWEWAWIAAGVVGWESLAGLLSVSPQFWLSFCISGWITTLVCLGVSDDKEPPGGMAATGSSKTLNLLEAQAEQSRWVWVACGLYAAIFITMNWRLYFNLLIPHGDSAMYEEHLWNLLHGKGFRSYLDRGLFFGEHIQFVHLFLIPLYIFWHSHLLLEACESTALALGAFPVYWMTQRHSRSNSIALAASVAYLLYTPMQFLDIEIDLKTFRPEAFGIPLLLLTLDQLERRHWNWFLAGAAMTFTVKEDYALIFAPLGLWISIRGGRALLPVQVTSTNALQSRSSDKQSSSNGWVIKGLSLSSISVIYLWLATRVIIPWFRSGVEVHYASYFKKFGESPEQIVSTMLTQPGLLFGELVTIPTVLYAMAMLAPVAFLAIFSPGRLAVGLPLFGILCLNDLAKDPRHQFHAPLVAIVFWAVAGGLPQASKILMRSATRLGIRAEHAGATVPAVVRTLLWTSALTTGFFFTLSPLGITFWDPGSSWNWLRLYGHSERSEMFAHVPPLIPINSRVASTDFVHPRFTHHERSYDYSAYRREVSNFELRVPDDTDFIVIDTRHPYSEIKKPEEVREYRDHPDEWELLPDKTEGYFIVLKRRR